MSFEVTVRLLGGLMALGYTITTILKRASQGFSDERVCIKIDKLEQLQRKYIQVQNNGSLRLKQLFGSVRTWYDTMFSLGSRKWQSHCCRGCQEIGTGRILHTSLIHRTNPAREAHLWPQGVILLDNIISVALHLIKFETKVFKNGFH